MLIVYANILQNKRGQQSESITNQCTTNRDPKEVKYGNCDCFGESGATFFSYHGGTKPEHYVLEKWNNIKWNNDGLKNKKFKLCID